MFGALNVLDKFNLMFNVRSSKEIYEMKKVFKILKKGLITGSGLLKKCQQTRNN